MTLRHGELLLASFFAACGIYCVVVGLRFPYYNRLGPGPGFFPIWIGLLLTLLSAGILGTGLMRQKGEDPQAGTPFFESGAAAIRVIGTFLFLLLACWLLGFFGFRATMFVFALLTPFIISRQNPVVVTLVALAVSFGTAYAFETWLGVQLPHPSIQWLQDLGM